MYFYAVQSLRYWRDTRANGWPVHVENKHEIGYLPVFDDYDTALAACGNRPELVMQIRFREQGAS